MPGESLETGELQERLNEALERAEEAGEERASPKWMLSLSLSTAIIAVMAAISSFQAGFLANHAILYKNEAVLDQTKAMDEWAYYQAKGVKAVIYQTQADMLASQRASAGQTSLAEKFQTEAKHYRDEQTEIKTQADDLEAKVKESNEEAEQLMHHHHQFALSVTLFQVAIALAAIASLTRRKKMWHLGLAIAAVAMVFFLRGWIWRL